MYNFQISLYKHTPQHLNRVFKGKCTTSWDSHGSGCLQNTKVTITTARLEGISCTNSDCVPTPCPAAAKTLAAHVQL